MNQYPTPTILSAKRSEISRFFFTPEHNGMAVNMEEINKGEIWYIVNSLFQASNERQLTGRIQRNRQQPESRMVGSNQQQLSNSLQLGNAVLIGGLTVLAYRKLSRRL